MVIVNRFYASLIAVLLAFWAQALAVRATLTHYAHFSKHHIVLASDGADPEEAEKLELSPVGDVTVALTGQSMSVSTGILRPTQS